MAVKGKSLPHPLALLSPLPASQKQGPMKASAASQGVKRNRGKGKVLLISCVFSLHQPLQRKTMKLWAKETCRTTPTKRALVGGLAELGAQGQDAVGCPAQGTAQRQLEEAAFIPPGGLVPGSAPNWDFLCMGSHLLHHLCAAKLCMHQGLPTNPMQLPAAPPPSPPSWGFACPSLSLCPCQSTVGPPTLTSLQGDICFPSTISSHLQHVCTTGQLSAASLGRSGLWGRGFLLG